MNSAHKKSDKSRTINDCERKIEKNREKSSFVRASGVAVDIWPMGAVRLPTSNAFSLRFSPQTSTQSSLYF